MRKFILICVCVFCCAEPLSAQEEIDPCVKELLGEYVDYINDNIRALELYRQRFERFNRELNLYFESSPNVRKALTLSFPDEEILDHAPYYKDLTPHKRYLLLQSREGCLQGENVADLYKDAHQIEDVMQEVVSIGKAMVAYTQSDAYREEDDLETAFHLLSRSYVLFHDFSALKDALHYESTKIYRELKLDTSKDPYGRSTRALMAVLVPARAILKAMKEDNDGQIRSNVMRMRAAIDRARRNAVDNLSGVPDKGTRDEPRIWYHYVLAVADDFRAASLEYLENPTFPRRYQKYGAAFYYYNQRLLRIYNRAGEGMVDRYNRLVDASEMPLLKMVEEPAWMMLAMPGEQAEDPPPPPEIVVAEDTLPEPEPIPEPEPELEVVVVVPVEEAASDMPPDTVETEVLATIPPPVEVVDSSPPPAPLPPIPTSLEGAAPNNLVFLLDVSSSMSTDEKLPLLINSFIQLLDLMRPQDFVSIVTYSGKATVALAPTSSVERSRIVEVLVNLTSEGKTDALEGVVLAYRVAQNGFIPEGNNRIIMASDGYFRIPEALPRLVGDKAKQGIHMSVFFFGQAEAKITDRLDRLASIGEGNFRHIQPDNASRMLIEEANAVKEK